MSKAVAEQKKCVNCGAEAEEPPKHCTSEACPWWVCVECNHDNDPVWVKAKDKKYR